MVKRKQATVAALAAALVMSSTPVPAMEAATERTTERVTETATETATEAASEKATEPGTEKEEETSARTADLKAATQFPIDLTVEWDDDDDAAGKRPESVTLYVDDAEGSKPVTISAADGWKKTAKVAYDSSKGVSLENKDKDPEGYTHEMPDPEVKDDMSGFVGSIKFTYSGGSEEQTKKTTTASATIAWDDGGVTEGRPESVTVNVTDGTNSYPITASAATGWKGSVEVPVGTAENPISYQALYDLPEGCSKSKTSISGDAKSGYEFTITFTREVEKAATAEVELVWDGDAEKPASVTAELSGLVDGEWLTRGTAELTEANGWKGKATDLPAEMEDGTPIRYKWTIGNVDGWQGAPNASGSAGSYKTTIAMTPIEKASKKYSTLPTTAKVVWENDEEGDRPESLTVTSGGLSDEFGAAEGWTSDELAVPIDVTITSDDTADTASAKLKEAAQANPVEIATPEGYQVVNFNEKAPNGGAVTFESGRVYTVTFRKIDTEKKLPVKQQAAIEWYEGSEKPAEIGAKFSGVGTDGTAKASEANGWVAESPVGEYAAPLDGNGNYSLAALKTDATAELELPEGYEIVKKAISQTVPEKEDDAAIARTTFTVARMNKKVDSVTVKAEVAFDDGVKNKPSKVMAKITKDGQPFDEMELNEANGWKASKVVETAERWESVKTVRRPGETEGDSSASARTLMSGASDMASRYAVEIEIPEGYVEKSGESSTTPEVGEDGTDYGVAVRSVLAESAEPATEKQNDSETGEGKVTISFMNGDKEQTLTLDKGQGIELPLPSIGDSDVFLGWYTEPDGKGTRIGGNGDVWTPTGSVKLYASVQSGGSKSQNGTSNGTNNGTSNGASGTKTESEKSTEKSTDKAKSGATASTGSGSSGQSTSDGAKGDSAEAPKTGDDLDAKPVAGALATLFGLFAAAFALLRRKKDEI